MKNRSKILRRHQNLASSRLPHLMNLHLTTVITLIFLITGKKYGPMMGFQVLTEKLFFTLKIVRNVTEIVELKQDD